MEPSENYDAAVVEGSGTVLDRRSFLVGSVLAAGGGVAQISEPRAFASPIPKAQFGRMVPDNVGAWRSRRSAELVVKAADQEEDKLYENLETRIYEGPGLPSMMLLIAYSSIQQNDVQVHRPEVCYPAAGFPIEQKRPVSIDFGPRSIDALELVADRGGIKERILYWVRVGEKFPSGWVDLRLTTAISNARGVTPDGVLFRVSAIDEGNGISIKTLMDFAKEFVAASPPALKKVVLF